MTTVVQGCSAYGGLRDHLLAVVGPALGSMSHLRDQEDQSISEIVEATGITRSSLYRYLPRRPPETLTPRPCRTPKSPPKSVAIGAGDF